MTNAEFLKVIFHSFRNFISSGTSRSTKKLKPLHGAIAQDIATRLGYGYEVYSQGYQAGKEAIIPGRYFNKYVDISISDGNKMVCGIAVKFIMQNYSQNSNNYFENMLGETANIRCGSCPYFQIFIILDTLPYYTKDKKIIHWEIFTEHNASKYLILSKDDTNRYFHAPNKTLIFVVHIPENKHLKNQQEYLRYYSNLDENDVRVSNTVLDQFDNAVILNDYETFMNKVYYTIKSL
ncbi:MAG: hypothetical protein LUC91_11560 [Prevotella sp.]|nr:hypothetical protein [Prevotella sp.]